MIEHGSVRNLEQIQEEDDAGRMPRAASLAIVALGGACIVFATLALGGRRPAAAATASCAAAPQSTVMTSSAPPARRARNAAGLGP